MNRILIQERLKKVSERLDSREVKMNEKNIDAFYVADVIAGHSFVQNYGGHPRSDIAQIEAETNMANQMSMLAMLQEMPVSNENSGLSDAEIMLSHRSKYMQTPSESVRWLEGQLAERDAKRYTESVKKSQMQFNSSDLPVSEKAVDDV